MVTANKNPQAPFRLVVTGEAESWLPALEQVVGWKVLEPHRVDDGDELIEVVKYHRADAAVLDDQVAWGVDILGILRMIRRLDARLPVVVVTSHRDRRWLQAALELRAYSVLARPLEFEALLRQIHGMMLRLSGMLHDSGGPFGPPELHEP